MTISTGTTRLEKKSKHLLLIQYGYPTSLVIIIVGAGGTGDGATGVVGVLVEPDSGGEILGIGPIIITIIHIMDIRVGTGIIMFTEDLTAVILHQE